MILQTGFRTDIPGFYSTWFANRLRAGFVLVRNPYDPQSVTRYAINPDVVDLIGFCTKNPAPMLPRMELLRPYGQYWFVTITPYGPEIEPHVPPKAQVLPVPVGALAMTSLSASSSGIAFCWISVISVKPISAMAFFISSRMGSSW